MCGEKWLAGTDSPLFIVFLVHLGGSVGFTWRFSDGFWAILGVGYGWSADLFLVLCDALLVAFLGTELRNSCPHPRPLPVGRGDPCSWDLRAFQDSCCRGRFFGFKSN